MKNSFKNALNALGLLGFMVLAWATKRDINLEPIKMEVKINADSTAFLLKNLENIDFSNGNAQVFVFRDTAQATFGRTFFADSVSIKSNATISIPFSEFKSSNGIGAIEIFSKNVKPNRFIFNGALRKDASGLFEFDF
jgi:hypothetical protein